MSFGANNSVKISLCYNTKDNRRKIGKRNTYEVSFNYEVDTTSSEELVYLVIEYFSQAPEEEVEGLIRNFMKSLGQPY